MLTKFVPTEPIEIAKRNGSVPSRVRNSTQAGSLTSIIDFTSKSSSSGSSWRFLVLTMTAYSITTEFGNPHHDRRQARKPGYPPSSFLGLEQRGNA